VVDSISRTVRVTVAQGRAAAVGSVANQNVAVNVGCLTQLSPLVPEPPADLVRLPLVKAPVCQ
jgi:hypothetical protein